MLPLAGNKTAANVTLSNDNDLIAPNESHPTGIKKHLLLIFLFLGALLVLTLGAFAVIAKVSKNPAQIMSLPTPLLTLLNSNALTRTPQTMIVASLKATERLTTFNEVSEVSLKIEDPKGTNLGSLTIKIQSPVKVSTETDSDVEFSAKAKVFMEYVYDEQIWKDGLDIFYPGMGEGLVPNSPAVIGGEIIVMNNKTYFLLERGPKIKLFNLDLLTNIWWSMDNQWTDQDIAEQVTNLNKNHTTLKNELSKLLQSAKAIELEAATEKEQGDYLTLIKLEKEAVKSFLVALMTDEDDFYSSSYTKQQVEQNIDELFRYFGSPGSSTIDLQYGIDRETKFPVKIKAEYEIADFSAIGQAYLLPNHTNVLGARYLQSYPDYYVSAEEALVPDRVVFSLETTLSEHNQPIHIVEPASTQDVSNIPLAEIIKPFNEYLDQLAEAEAATPMLLDPVEQLDQATDMQLLSDATLLINALERYYTTFQKYPWGEVPPQAQCPLMRGNPLTCDSLNGLVDVNSLIDEGEVREDFATKELNRLLITEDGEKYIHICFEPQSQEWFDYQNQIYNERGEPWSEGKQYTCIPY